MWKGRAQADARRDERAAVASPPGKGHRDENFPGRIVFCSAEHRAPIMAFYRFARAADDVADHPTAQPLPTSSRSSPRCDADWRARASDRRGARARAR